MNAPFPRASLTVLWMQQEVRNIIFMLFTFLITRQCINQMESDLLVRTSLMAGFLFFHAVTVAKELIDVFIMVKVGMILKKG